MGGELVPLIGFPDLIRSIGFLNLLFCPFMVLLSGADLKRVEPGMQSLVSSASSEEEDEDNFSNFNKNSSGTAATTLGQSGSGKISRSVGVTTLTELLPLKSYQARYIQSSSYSSNYQRFHDQLDSD